MALQFVTKRDGSLEAINYDAITRRLTDLRDKVPRLDRIDIDTIKQKLVSYMVDKISTAELDDLAADTAIHMSTSEPQYGDLASRIAVSSLHKETPDTFHEAMKLAYNHKLKTTGEPSPLISKELWKLVNGTHRPNIEEVLDYQRDYDYDFFAINTLQRGYLLKVDGIIVERPQHMLMRVSIGVHGKDIDRVIKSYHYMSQKYYTHATPTLFNAGTPRAQMSSCFLVTMKDDSIEGIYATLGILALISKYAGGIGLSIHNIRASHSYIAGTNGESNGIVPMLRVFNDTARYVDQGTIHLILCGYVSSNHCPPPRRRWQAQGFFCHLS